MPDPSLLKPIPGFWMSRRQLGNNPVVGAGKVITKDSSRQKKSAGRVPAPRGSRDAV